MIIGVVVPLVVLLVLLSGYAAYRLWPFVVGVVVCLAVGFVVRRGSETLGWSLVAVLVLAVLVCGAVWVSGRLERWVVRLLGSGRHREDV